MFFKNRKDNWLESLMHPEKMYTSILMYSLLISKWNFGLGEILFSVLVKIFNCKTIELTQTLKYANISVRKFLKAAYPDFPNTAEMYISLQKRYHS